MSRHCLPSLQRLPALHCSASTRQGLYINYTWGFRDFPLSRSWTNWDDHFQHRAGKGRPQRPGAPASPGQGWLPGQGGLQLSAPNAGALLPVTSAQRTSPNWKLKPRPFLVFRGKFQRIQHSIISKFCHSPCCCTSCGIFKAFY